MILDYIKFKTFLSSVKHNYIYHLVGLNAGPPNRPPSRTPKYTPRSTSNRTPSCTPNCIPNRIRTSTQNQTSQVVCNLELIYLVITWCTKCNCYEKIKYCIKNKHLISKALNNKTQFTVYINNIVIIPPC